MIKKIFKDDYLHLITEHYGSINIETLKDVDVTQYSDEYYTNMSELAICGLHYQKHNIVQLNGLISFSPSKGVQLLKSIIEKLTLEGFNYLRLNCTPILFDKIYNKVGFKKYLELDTKYIECILKLNKETND